MNKFLIIIGLLFLTGCHGYTYYSESHTKYPRRNSPGYTRTYSRYTEYYPNRPTYSQGGVSETRGRYSSVYAERGAVKHGFYGRASGGGYSRVEETVSQGLDENGYIVTDSVRTYNGSIGVGASAGFRSGLNDTWRWHGREPTRRVK